MKKHSGLIVVLVLLFFFASSYREKTKHKSMPEPVAHWTGTIQYDETDIFTNPAMTGKGERHMSATFVNAMPTLYRDDDDPDLNFTDNKGTGTHSYNSKVKLGVSPATIDGCTDCQGSGQAELHSVVVREWDNTYDIEVIPPACTGTNCDGSTYGPETKSITVGNQPLKNRDILDGSITETGEMVGGFGTYTRTTIWHFERVTEIDVELIVTPQNYDTWLPQPGMDELNKGAVMTVDLKLQGINGKPLKAKVESFELRLNNTSIEPGITINYPLSPRAKQLPDLRFLLLPGVESGDEDQFISIGSSDGKTGKAFIGSYDGGGWTTLTVEAVLNDKRRIKGHLLVPGGDVDILIPKRIPGTSTALAWSKLHGNPSDIDDKERSNKNQNNGDGLTAYEEYRGVISEGVFKRLDPQKKELGILVKRSEKALFKEGFSTFTNASNIETVLFDKNEIPDNRRLNQNAHTAHDFKQYVLRIAKGNTSLPDMQGRVIIAYGLTYPTNDIPARVTHIIIDVDRIHSDYIRLLRNAGSLPYTEKDVLAYTIAHEIGHGVNVEHHGEDLPYLHSVTVYSVVDTSIVFYPNRMYMTRPYTVGGSIGLPGNRQSGDVGCIMCYVNQSYWVQEETHYSATPGYNYLETPILPYGKSFCIDKKGAGLNANNKYYGNTKKGGECLTQIKLRE